jgi:hypothetical protein
MAGHRLPMPAAWALRGSCRPSDAHLKKGNWHPAAIEFRRAVSGFPDYAEAVDRRRVAPAVRSDLSIDAQVQAGGATWLDRQLVARQLAAFSSDGFGREVSEAMDARVERLVGEGFANRQGQRVIFARDLLDTLRRRELNAVAARISASTGLAHHPAREGEPVVGTYRQRLDLASGRFALNARA